MQEVQIELRKLVAQLKNHKKMQGIEQLRKTLQLERERRPEALSRSLPRPSNKPLLRANARRPDSFQALRGSKVERVVERRTVGSREYPKYSYFLSRGKGSAGQLSKARTSCSFLSESRPEKSLRAARPCWENYLSSVAVRKGADPVLRYEDSAKRLREMIGAREKFQDPADWQSEIKARTLEAETPMKREENLFTDPELLSQCREYIEKSEQKCELPELALSNLCSLRPCRQQDDPPPLARQRAPPEPRTERLEKPSFGTLEELLKEIYAQAHCVVLGDERRQELVAGCEQELQTSVRELLEAFPLDARIPFTVFCQCCWKEAQELFPAMTSESIAQVLDLDKKGFILPEDLEGFLESLRAAGVEQSALAEIGDALGRVFELAQALEQQAETSFIGKWALFYLEITKEPNFTRLCRLFEEFEFHFED